MSPTQREFVKYKVLKAIEHNPNASQRELAKNLGVSLGSVNYCVKALVEKGFIKVENFIKSDNKKSYSYFITPRGMVEKGEITAQFLKTKMAEYDLLKAEISALKEEVAEQTSTPE